jgi:hypothetical protein
MTTICSLLLVGAAACGGGEGNLDTRVWPRHDTRREAPAPWFLDGGCLDGMCSPPPPRDLGRAEAKLPPDLCLPPTSCEVMFSYAKGSESSVELAGDFFGATWTRLPMTLVGASWQKSLSLKQGQRVLYKFVLDGKTWVPDPKNPKQEDDGLGGKNSVLDVACPNPCP